MTDDVPKQVPDIPPEMPAGSLIANFIKLRDRIKATEDKQKKELAPAKELLIKMNNRLLELLNNAGGDGIQASAGTAYRTQRVSASISDGAAFRDYVVANELFDMLDWKANPNAVQDHIAEFGGAPPGVNLNVAFTVGVRRASEK